MENINLISLIDDMELDDIPHCNLSAHNLVYIQRLEARIAELEAIIVRIELLLS